MNNDDYDSISISLSSDSGLDDVEFTSSADDFLISELYDETPIELPPSSKKSVPDLSSMCDDKGGSRSKPQDDVSEDEMVHDSGGTTQGRDSSSTSSVRKPGKVELKRTKGDAHVKLLSGVVNPPKWKTRRLQCNEKLEGDSGIPDKGEQLPSPRFGFGSIKKKAGVKRKRVQESSGKDGGEKCYTKGDFRTASSMLRDEKETYLGIPLRFGTAKEIQDFYKETIRNPPPGWNGDEFLRRAFERLVEYESNLKHSPEF